MIPFWKTLWKIATSAWHTRLWQERIQVCASDP
jgi:hypothetical protein